MSSPVTASVARCTKILGTQLRSRGSGKQIKNGLCIAIEPMITLGNPAIGLLPDRWGIITLDRRPAAHFEHTIAIHHGKPEILSTFEDIERVEGHLY